MIRSPSADLLGRPVVSAAATSLDAVLRSGHAGAIATLARAAATDGEAEQLLLDAIGALFLRDEQGLDGSLVAAVACLRVLPEHAGVRAALPVARGLDVISAVIISQAVRSAQPDAAALSADELGAALQAAAGPGTETISAAAAAERAVRSAGAGDVDTGALTQAVVDLFYAQAGRCVHLAPIVVASLEFVRLADRAVAVDALARTARSILLLALPAQPDNDALIAPILGAAARIHAAQDVTKAAVFQEARFRPHLLAAKPAALVRAVAKALAFGVPRGRVAGSLCLAAAERVLRFDPAIARSVRRRETWLDVAWLLQICEAVRTLAVWHDRPEWLGLLLHATLWVRAAQPLDAADPFVLPEPETLARTWDHGPEIARVTGAMLRGDGPKAMAVLRGYLMMVLPEQPLSAEIAAAALEDRASSAIEQGALVANVVAALASFGAAAALPHRDLLLCAALHVFTAPQPPRAVYTLTHAEVDSAEGAAPPSAISPLPWLSTALSRSPDRSD